MDQRIATFLTNVLALADEQPVALGDLLDGFALTVLIAVAIGTTYYAIRVVEPRLRWLRDRCAPACTATRSTAHAGPPH